MPALLDRIEAEMGPVTTLVSNAGVPAKVRGDMLDLAPDSFDFVLGVNLRGTFFLAQETARRMLTLPPEPYRSIVFVTSVSAAMVSIERAEYCISKAGAAMMAELFAVRLAPHGIGVFEIRPGIIETGMTAGVKDKYTARIEGGLVPPRAGASPRTSAPSSCRWCAATWPSPPAPSSPSTAASPSRGSEHGGQDTTSSSSAAARPAACSRRGSPRTRPREVLLLEAGGRDRHPFYHLPGGLREDDQGHRLLGLADACRSGT